MKKIVWPVLSYSVVLIGLGYLGYKEAASKVSLYAGVGSGMALLFSSLLLCCKDRLLQKIGAYLSLAITGMLTAVFAVRYSNTGKEFPAIFAVISGVMLLYLLLKVLPRSKD